MKIGLYSPYLPGHFGGGEKHFLTSAWYLSQKHDVTILIPPDTKYLDKRIQEYQALFGLDLSKIKWQPSQLATGQNNPLQTWWQTKSFDTFLYLTDGSLFISGAKNNILHLQFPFTSQTGRWHQFKLKNWNVKNANSQFTKKTVEKAWQTKINYLHYPYVKLPQKWETNKQPFILSVGRFMDPTQNVGHSKHQELLIESFIAGQRKYGWKKWQLVLVGSVEPGSVHANYLSKLKTKAKGADIKFYHGISDTHLRKLYNQSSIFWHAAGFGIDETKHPKQVEHFGMSTLEAMAYGSIPIVIKKGGLKEMVTENENGFFFEEPDQLIQKTNQVIKANTKEKHAWRLAAHEKAQDFSLTRFCDTLEEMIHEHR